MIRVTYYRSAEPDEAIVEVFVDEQGLVAVTSAGQLARGALPEEARRRLVADVVATTYSRLGRRIGRGPALARVEAASGSCLVAFEGDTSAFQPEGWRVPVGRHVRDLARIARALHDGTLATIDLGLPDVVREEGLLLSFEIGAGRIEHTLFAYDDGTIERWKLIPDHRTPRGERVRVDRASVHDVRDAHAAAVRLLDALRVAGPMPVMSAAHDPTDSLELRVVRDGRSESWATTWGRASGNDAPLAPVPEDVPIVLFDDLAKRLRALRDAPSTPYASLERPAPPPRPIVYEWGDVTPVDAPTSAPPPSSARPIAPAVRSGGRPHAMEEIVRALIERPPHTLRALEATIGTLEGFARHGEGFGSLARDDHPGLDWLAIEYAVDLDHESPLGMGDRRDPGLLEVRLRFAESRVGATTVAASFAGRLEGVPYRHGLERGLRFGDHWFVPDDGRSLTWVFERPAWSIEVPAVDPRIAWLEALRSTMVSAAPLSALLAWAERELPFGTHSHGCVNGDDLQLSLHPPLSLDVLLDALAIEGAFVSATDEHMSMDEVYVRAPAEDLHPFALPELGPFSVGVRVSQPIEKRGARRAVATFVGSAVYEARGAGFLAAGLTLRDRRIAQR